MKEQIQKRTKQIGLEVIKLIDELPNKSSGWAIAKQAVRSALPKVVNRKGSVSKVNGTAYSIA